MYHSTNSCQQHSTNPEQNSASAAQTLSPWAHPRLPLMLTTHHTAGMQHTPAGHYACMSALGSTHMRVGQGSDLRGSVSEVDGKGGRQALIRPAGKVHQLHTEAAAEPHHVGRPQVAMHNVPLVQPTQCLAHLRPNHPDVPTSSPFIHMCASMFASWSGAWFDTWAAPLPCCLTPLGCVSLAADSMQHMASQRWVKEFRVLVP